MIPIQNKFRDELAEKLEKHSRVGVKSKANSESNREEGEAPTATEKTVIINDNQMMQGVQIENDPTVYHQIVIEQVKLYF